MGQRPRYEEEGAVHHVIVRGNNRELVFRVDMDRVLYLSYLAATAGRRRWRVLAYCLMSNHVHLLIETREPNLGRGMQWLQSTYTRDYHRRHARSGHLFGARYWSARVHTERHLWATAAYIARNPVRATLCEQPEQWPWSSHAATLNGLTPAWMDVPRLLEYFSILGGDPLERYASFVASRDPRAPDLAHPARPPRL